MKKFVLSFFFAATCAFAQQPSIEELKIAADTGDPIAQDKLAARVEFKQSEVLYRKAAGQGYAHAQGKLGNILFLRCQLSTGLKPVEKAAIADEAIKWATLAANQGDKQGQSDLARMYLEGKVVKMDLIEAYKWGELAARNPSPVFVIYPGDFTRDNAILKMNAAQMAEARHRVAEFKTHVPLKSEVPAPAWVKNIKLKGISGAPGRRLATIGKATFAPGEHGMVKIDGQPVSIQCLEITDTTAIITIEGIEGRQTLTLD